MDIHVRIAGNCRTVCSHHVFKKVESQVDGGYVFWVGDLSFQNALLVLYGFHCRWCFNVVTLSPGSVLVLTAWLVPNFSTTCAVVFWAIDCSWNKSRKMFTTAVRSYYCICFLVLWVYALCHSYQDIIFQAGNWNCRLNSKPVSRVSLLVCMCVLVLDHHQKNNSVINPHSCLSKEKFNPTSNSAKSKFWVICLWMFTMWFKRGMRQRMKNLVIEQVAVGDFCTKLVILGLILRV